MIAVFGALSGCCLVVSNTPIDDTVKHLFFAASYFRVFEV